MLPDGGPVATRTPSVDVGGSKGRRAFWIEFDKEASFVTRDEAGVFCSTEHLADSRISCTVYTDDDVPGFTRIHTYSWR